MAALALAAVAGVDAAGASKQVYAYFGSESSGPLGGEFRQPHGIAIDSSGAGPANPGDVYVVDSDNNRIERFNSEGGFVSAWGAGVSSSSSGGNYEICTVAADCGTAVESGGNRTVAGDGGLANPQSIAVDQETGEVYVSDLGNHRIDVYAGDGTFLRAFGFDVVESGPDNAGGGYEICVAANGDVCKAGVAGSGTGQLGAVTVYGATLGIAISPPDGNPVTGTVFLADTANRRIDTYGLDGANPGSFGSSAQFDAAQPRQVAVDSRGIVYASNSRNGEEIERYDTSNADGAGVGFLAPIAGAESSPAGPLLAGERETGTAGLAAVPGTGGEPDVLYVLRDPPFGNTVVQQLGPVNKPGLLASPTGVDEEHGSQAGFTLTNGLGVNTVDKRLYISSEIIEGVSRNGVYVLDNVPVPTVAVDSIAGITATGATVNGTIDPGGPPDVSYRLEYSADGGVSWRSTPSTTLGSQNAPQAVGAALDPPLGLEPNTTYQVRLVATRPYNTPVFATSSFTTAPQAPLVETTGSPIRTATTALLQSRINPRNSPTAYRFEYGPTADYGQSTPPVSAGSGGLTEMASQTIAGLEPNTTYHYRLIGDNGAAGSPSFGQDMTVTTRASDAPLTHGSFPGPPGSDRAWEQVNAPDTGGNPVVGALAISDAGDRAVYQVAGGTPISEVGTLYDQFLAERTATGWQTKKIYPSRSAAPGGFWLGLAGSGDLSSLVDFNGDSATGAGSYWRLGAETAPGKLYESGPGSFKYYEVSADGSRAVALLAGSLDPAHRAAGLNLYDIASGSPKLVSMMPNGTAKCGVQSSSSAFDLPVNFPRRSTHWISPDGSLVFFPSEGENAACGSSVPPARLYMRDLGTQTTTLISGQPVSGPACPVAFVKATPGAVFFWTQTRLVAGDSPPSNCYGSANGDVYRYDIARGTSSCVTCLVPGVEADVIMDPGSGHADEQIAVAEDGSRVYFSSPHSLIAGQGPGIYRVDVATGGLAYVAPAGRVGESAQQGEAMTPNGSVVVFASSAASLNALTGSDNGGTPQYYRYDDRDRSLLCVSCPPDGSPPTGAVPVEGMLSTGSRDQAGPNLTPLDERGDFLFATPTPLAPSDINTARPGQDPGVGRDVYEWRDGQALLVSDGVTSWPSAESGPDISGMTPNGRDVFFTEAAQLTPDAPDAFRRLYDARIGGGFEFPQPQLPCPLEVCQGGAAGAPIGPFPGSTTFSGPGNLHPSNLHPKVPHRRRHGKSAKRRCPRHARRGCRKRRARRARSRRAR